MRAGLHCQLLTAALAACLLVVPVAGQERTPQLQAILDRAAEYVAIYEDRELGNVLAFESYVQTVDYRGVRAGMPGPRVQRRTESDFLIVLVGSERMGIRKVNRVDGAPAKNSAGDLEGLMDDSPEGIRKRIGAFNAESSQYNLGPVFGQINLPTFGLKVLRRTEAPRFSFVQRGTAKINGVQGIEVRFQELRSPTLVHGKGGESLTSSGVLWIEPATGRVLKTQLEVENPYTKTKGRVTVTYSANKTLGILVPDELKEHYEGENGVVDCTATYSRFRSFNVDLKTDIKAPEKR